MRITERILLLLSRPPDGPDCIPKAPDKHNIDNGLDDLFASFPELRTKIQSKSILDYGCGPGWQSICLARGGAKHVVGIDINPTWIEHARNLILLYDLSDRTDFYQGWNEQLSGQFDLVISKDSFEHYQNPELALEEMKKALKPNGKLYIVFSWPWYSPLGSHMQVFTVVPWVNLLFSEKTIMRVRSRYRNDGAMRYEDVESGLNKMSVRRCERIINSSNLFIEKKFLRGFKGLNFLTTVPLLRELFTQQVGFILSLANGR